MGNCISVERDGKNMRKNTVEGKLEAKVHLTHKEKRKIVHDFNNIAGQLQGIVEFFEYEEKDELLKLIITINENMRSFGKNLSDSLK